MSGLAAWLGLIPDIVPFVIKGFIWIRNRIKWRGISEEARKAALAIHNFSWTNLQQTAPVINRVGSIDRPEIEQIQNIWQSTDTPILLYGEAGTGKSGIALRLGQALVKAGTPILFMRATDFPNGQDPIAIIQNRMALNIPLMDALDKLSKERVFAVIVDQLDSVAGTDLGKNFTSFLKALDGIFGIRVLAVSRTYECLNDQDISTLGFQKVECGRLTGEQALQYLSRIGLVDPSPSIVVLASNLLNLSLISDVVTLTPDHPRAIFDEVELWKQFLVTIQRREGNEAAEFAMKLAREVTAKGERDFPVEFPSIGIQRKLLSRGILVSSRAKRYTFRHERLQDFLCVYALFPEQPTFSQLLGEFENSLLKGVIFWLHLLYHTERLNLEPAFVDAVLEAREKLPFYTRIQVLENLRQQKDPNPQIAKAIARHSSDKAYQRYFFDGLENPAWVIPLHKVEFFHCFPGPIEVEPGFYQLPGWPAGEYLARFASQYEAAVVDIVKAAKTENWRVQEILIDALLQISPAAAANLVLQIDAWLDGRFSRTLPDKLIPLADHLRQAGFVDATIQILESVTKPVLPFNAKGMPKYHSNVRFRSDHYWVNEYCEKQLPGLLTINPAGVVSVFERQLVRLIGLVKQAKVEDAEKQVGHYWRMDISYRFSERDDADALDILVDGLRDSVAEVCKRSVHQGGQFLSTYLASEHLIFQRIALYTLRLYGQNYPEMVNQVLLERDYLDQGEYADEYRGLMRDQFANASSEVRGQVIAWILAGPTERINREEAEVNRSERQGAWTLFHLKIIQNFLFGEALERLNELVAIYGEPSTEERPHRVVGLRWEIPSPVSAEELAKKSFDELKQLLLTYVPKDSFLNPSEGLAHALQKIVHEDPNRYSEFAAYLTDPAIRFVYIYHYLSGIRESIKEQQTKLEDVVLDLCEYLVVQKEDPFASSSQLHEPGLPNCQMEMAHLLDESLHSDDPYLIRRQLDRIRSLLVLLAHHPDPETGSDAQTSFDPFTHSMNCVRGVAMHGIFHYSLYLIRQQKKLKNEELKTGFLESQICEILEEKLDLGLEPSLAVHAVYGAFIPQLHYLGREWLEKHLEDIFPRDEEKFAYWKAAWDAYILASNVYQDVFKLLIPQYQRSLGLLSQPENEKISFGNSPKERLAQHIMFAYLAGLTDFGHENMLFDVFFAHAPDLVRANGIFWLTRVLGEEKPSAEDDLWKKCWALWQKRLQDADTQDVSLNTQEISSYARWLDNCPVGLDILFPALCQTIKYLHDDFDAKEITSYAAEHCERFPLEAVTLLQMNILSAKESWWHPERDDEGGILRIALTSGNPAAHQIALEVINYRGEQGDFRWKQLLE